MKRFAQWLCLLCVLALLPLGALADQLYLIDSDRRLITEEELWAWDRESLSFMFNEIFARHGFTFEPGGKFYNWFSNQPWYQETDKVPDEVAYQRTTELEWTNYDTIKKVITQMEAVNHPYRKPLGSDLKSWSELGTPGQWSLTGFQFVNLRVAQDLAVYSAPSASSWRGANGRAMVSTVGAVWAAGWENGWLLVFYEINNGVRVGYVRGSEMAERPILNSDLSFSYTAVPILNNCALTDDPLSQSSTITTLRQGQTVTYLSTMVNQYGQAWDYIETSVNGQTVRGFVRSGYVEIPEDTLPDVDGFAGNAGPR